MAKSLFRSIGRTSSLHPLLDLVHAARRRRLVQFIARVIASDIRREERRKEKSDVT